MSGKVGGGVWEVAGLTTTQRDLLLALADHADPEGGSIFPSVARLEWKLEASRSTVKRALRDLREAGLLRVVRPAGYRRPTEYRIDLSGAARKPAYAGEDQPRGAARAEVVAKFEAACARCERQGTERRDPDRRPWAIARVDPREGWDWANLTLLCEACQKGSAGDTLPAGEGCHPERDKGVKSGEKGSAAVTPESSVEPSLESSAPPANARAREGEDPGRPLMVGGRSTSAEERTLAASVLAEFNRAAGADFRSPSFLTAIIGRLRERPDLDLGAHRDLIARNFAEPWWKDSPSPSVIYGNERVFERCLNTRPTKAFSHERGGDLSAYDRGAGDD